MLQSAIYTGKVFHRRFGDPEHTLKYRAFFMLLSLDELPALKDVSALFSWNERAWFSFHDADHGSPEPAKPQNGATTLKTELEALLDREHLSANRWHFQLLTMPRTLGYAFNPISLIYCSDENHKLRAMIYEVNNTFGERFHYVLPVENDAKQIQQQCDKTLFVSPFFDTQGCYRFDVLRPGEKLSFKIDYRVDDELKLSASFTGQRLPFTSKNLRSLLTSHSMTTYKVVTGIHWEAAKLWWKGLPLVNHLPLMPPQTCPGDELPVQALEMTQASSKSGKLIHGPHSYETNSHSTTLSSKENSDQKEQDDR